jgi:hypothetical protein
LTDVSNAVSAVATTDEFHGDGLGTEWTSHGRRSAYIARFGDEGASASAANEMAHHPGE